MQLLSRDSVLKRLPCEGDRVYSVIAMSYPKCNVNLCCRTMDTLNQQVQSVVAGYARKGLNGESYLTKSDDGSVFTVVGVGRVQGKHISNVSLVVRVVGHCVIVERDQNDKPVVDALVQVGIPREQIILAYTGEPIPEGVC